ncbi:MAG: filamentous hemagglutinin N-terminal domain-containing protein [Nostoc sp.]|uniref:two-partner secretion domain-containing protein n=1 Tax=Nostoc sp. TaxID=1180 RepID=UPI002FFB638F
MSKISIRWGWFIGIAICGSSICSPNSAFAQIIPDGTLPDNSSVKLEGNNNIISGGTQVGGNLFHSFREFTVPINGAALFNNKADIQNIISRVTGGSVSNIDGLIGTKGTANLFLINPNGIVFGENAQLNVGGSFVASTANALQFGNRGFFSATEQNIPSPLLTINPSALLFNQINQNAAIQNNSVAPTGKDPAGFDVFGLRVPAGKSLLLVGGNVSMDGGELNAFGGQVELGGLAQAGTVGLGVNGDNLSLKFPDNVARTEVSLTNQAGIYVDGAGGGNIVVNASNLEILGLTFLSAGIGQGLGTPETVVGDITLNATGQIKVAGSGVGNRVRSGSKGNGGNITIESGSLSLQDDAALVAETLGQGNAGNVTVRALDNVSLTDAGIFSTVSSGGVGKGGNIDINAGTLSLIDSASLLTSNRSASATQPAARGDAGNVNVLVTGAVNIAGKKNGYPSGIFSDVNTGTVGNGGNITIDSGSFSLRNGAALVAETSGLGNAGNVTVRALDNVSLTDASILSTVGSGGVGKGGNIDINTGKLSLIDGAQLATITRAASATQPAGRGDAGNVNVLATGAVNIAGEKNGYPSGIFSQVETGTVGNGGDITIDSSDFSLRNGALLNASTSGLGNAGNVTVRALNAVSFADNAYIFSTVGSGGVGKGGNIDINAGTLSLIDGAQLATATRGAFATQPAGRGDAGNVNVLVTGAVNIAGEKNGFASGILSFVDTGTVGNGGNITIDSGSFSLSNRARLSASTSGLGNAGNVTVRTRDAVSFADNAYIFSTVESGGVGKGGNIDINAATLSLIDGAQLQTLIREASDTQPAGQGDAGNVNVKVTSAVNIAGVKNGFISGIGSLVQTGTVGNGGNITIDSGSFSLSDGAQLSASTSGLGNAGNVTVRTRDAVSLAGNAVIFSTVESGGVGKGGNIDINAATLSLIDGAQLTTITRETSDTQPAGRGDAGNVNVKVTSAIDIAGVKNDIASGIRSLVKTGTEGNGGNITIDSGSFSLSDGAQLSAETLGEGNAGTIKVNAADFFTISGNANFTSGLFVNSQTTTGTAGDIIVTSPKVTLDNSGTLNAQSASGNGGDINLQTDLLLLRRGAQISTTAGTAEAGGNGGNITINAPSGFIVAVPSENSDITANAYTGSGGKVDIQAFGIYGIQPRSNPTSLSDITASSEFGVSGTVELNTPDIDPNSGLVNLPTVPVDTSVAQTCQAGGNLAKSSFTITGRGGLPPNPGEALNTDAVKVDLVSLNPNRDKRSSSFVPSKITTPAPEPIIEATGMVLNEKGEVVLRANLPTTTPHSPWLKPASCRAIHNS